MAAVEVEQRLAALPPRLTELDRRVAESRSAGDRLPGARAELAAARAVRDAAAGLAGLNEAAEDAARAAAAAPTMAAIANQPKAPHSIARNPYTAGAQKRPSVPPSSETPW